MARQLATIRQVKQVIPIQGADRIAVAHMDGLGWDVVVDKTQTHPGALVVFFQIDSALKADDTRYSFLGKPRLSAKGSVYVLKTKKLRGVVSQGLVLPVKDFPQISNPKNGDDVTQTLGVMKWDEISLARAAQTAAVSKSPSGCSNIVRSDMPPFFPVTDQMRIQADTTLFDKAKDIDFTVEVKADGSSMSVYYVDSEYDHCNFAVCSHHRKLQWRVVPLMQRIQWAIKAKGIWNKLCRAYKAVVGWYKDRNYSGTTGDAFLDFAINNNFKQQLKAIYIRTNRNLVFQGQLVGPKLNGNRDRYTENHFLLFDIFDVDNKRYMLPAQRRDFYTTYLSSFMQCVTTKELACKVLSVYDSVQKIQKYATFMTPRGYMAQGIVCKSNSYPYVHFKCVSRQYLLKHKDS